MAVIGVDLDDVLVNFTDAYAAVCNKLFGRPEVVCQPVDWEWSNYQLTDEEKSKAWEVVQGTFNFWTTLNVEEGASFQAMENLRSKHDIFFITARVRSVGDSVQHQSCQWLLNNMGVPFPTVIVHHDKAPLASALKLDYFVDDRPKNCLEIKAAVPTCKVFLKDSSHNQDFKNVQNGIERVKDFNEFSRIVMEETQ
jgi:5'(3')-deoxyribonucleotidase